jgi:hypothetical protein
MMPEQYPLPAYAASFWIAGPDLWIAFPGQGPEGKGHSIRLPATVAGLATAIQILKDRAAADDLRLSQRGTPSQYEIENDNRYKALVRARAAERETTVEERARAKAELEELGL